MNKALIALLVGIIVAIVVVLWPNSNRPVPSESAAVGPPASQTSPEHIANQEYAAKGRVPAYHTVAPDPATLPATLSPEAFTGNKRLAYKAAQDIPQVLAQLPCYCHCDRSQGHKSLHSCFESEHGENCGICIGEALMAYNLHKQRVPVSEIRKQIIAAYGEP
jgi:hypothetical protein